MRKKKARRRHRRHVVGHTVRRKAGRPPGSYPQFDPRIRPEHRGGLHHEPKRPATGRWRTSMWSGPDWPQPPQGAAEGSFVGPWQNRDRRGNARLARVFLEQGAKTAHLSPCLVAWIRGRSLFLALAVQVLFFLNNVYDTGEAFYYFCRGRKVLFHVFRQGWHYFI